METSLAFSPFRLLSTLDELRLVVDELDEDDAFAFACACTPFRAATCLADGPFARFKDGVRTIIPGSKHGYSNLYSFMVVEDVTRSISPAP